MREQTTEQRETLKAEVLVPVKRFGTERVHFALVMPETITHGSVFGAPCQFVAAPVVAWCETTLRGRLILIPDADLDSWKRNGKVCRICQMVARMALAQHASSSSQESPNT